MYADAARADADAAEARAAADAAADSAAVAARAAADAADAFSAAVAALFSDDAAARAAAAAAVHAAAAADTRAAAADTRAADAAARAAAADAAAHAAARADAAAYSAVAAAAARPAARVAAAFRAAAADAARPAAAAARAAAAAVRRDCAFIDGADSTERIHSVPLWRDGANPMSDLWKSVKADWNARGADWQFWIDWYEAALEGRPLLGDWNQHWALLTEVALIPDRAWNEGSDHIGAIIQQILLKHDKADWSLHTLALGESEREKPGMDPVVFTGLIGSIASIISFLQQNNVPLTPRLQTH